MYFLVVEKPVFGICLYDHLSSILEKRGFLISMPELNSKGE